MSKGHGWLQRAILEAFDGVDALDSITAAARAFGCNPVNPAQAASARRALKALVADGDLVDLGRQWRDGRRVYQKPGGREGSKENRSNRYIAEMVLGGTMTPKSAGALRERMDQIQKYRPDLWLKVVSGEMTGKTAFREMKASS